MADNLKQILFPNDSNVLWFSANLNLGLLTEPITKFNASISSQISPDTTLVIDNRFEGQFKPWLKKVYELTQRNFLLKPEKVYYITASIEANELHDEFCFDNSIQDRINIVIINTWENQLKIISENISERVYSKQKKEKVFLCFNRILRPHRLGLLGLLSEKNLIDKAYYSFFNAHYFKDGIQKEGTPEMFNAFVGYLKNEIQSETDISECDMIMDSITNGINKIKLPLVLNAPCEQNTIQIIQSDEQYFKNSRFSLVTETHFFPGKINDEFQLYEVFFSEKTYKPILMKHPFILVGPYKSLFYLKKLGYKTFEPFIDESYDLEKIPIRRMQKIVNEVERLSKFTDQEWEEWEEGISSIVEHNYHIFKERTFEETILWKS